MIPVHSFLFVFSLHTGCLFIGYLQLFCYLSDGTRIVYKRYINRGNNVDYQHEIKHDATFSTFYLLNVIMAICLLHGVYTGSFGLIYAYLYFELCSFIFKMVTTCVFYASKGTFWATITIISSAWSIYVLLVVFSYCQDK